MQNIRNHQLFSSKVRIGVVNLNHTELATEEDIQYGLDKWVALFKSKTWEELKMIANEKPELLAASEALYKYNHEETIRWQCYAREDYRREMNRIERDMKRLAEVEEMLVEKDNLITEQSAYIKDLEAQLAQLQPVKP